MSSPVITFPGKLRMDSLSLEYHRADIHSALKFLGGCREQSSLCGSKQMDILTRGERMGRRRPPQSPIGPTFLLLMFIPVALTFGKVSGIATHHVIMPNFRFFSLSLFLLTFCVCVVLCACDVHPPAAI